jgi:hypothetical protein
MKIRPVGVELFHSDGGTDGQTDITKLIVGFRNFANVPENRLYTVRALIEQVLYPCIAFTELSL